MATRGVVEVTVGRDVRTLLAIVVLSAWTVAAIGFAVWLFVIAGRPGSLAGGALLAAPSVVAGLASWLLLAALLVVAVAWAVAFVGRGFSRPSTLGVVGLFLVALVAVLTCTRPVTDAWWSHGGVRPLGANAFAAVSWAQDSRAAGAILLVAVMGACGLLAIALRRPPRTVARTAGPGWYPHASGRLAYWDGQAWTMQAPVEPC